MEGATKWDPVCLKTSDEAQHIYAKLVNQKVSTVSVVSALEAELEQARTRIQELETEHHSSKKKLDHFLKKIGEEKAQWRSREHEKIRLYIDDIKTELNRERKSRQRIEVAIQANIIIWNP
jgi:chromosome segregation ATPase